jgi:hypothetical protein
MLNKRYALSLGCGLSFSALAGTMGTSAPLVDMHPWSVVGSIGYTYFQNTAEGGGTPVGRLGVAKDIFNLGDAGLNNDFMDMSSMHLGLEFGVQNGNRMSLSASQTALDALGGLPIWTTTKPMLDLLGTLKVAPMSDSPVFLTIKGGVAWRQWVLERDTINNLSQAAGEIQAGVGIPVADAATLSVLYQGIFGSSASLTANAATGLGTVSNIPVQNGVLLSLSMTL